MDKAWNTRRRRILGSDLYYDRLDNADDNANDYVMTRIAMLTIRTTFIMMLIMMITAIMIMASNIILQGIWGRTSSAEGSF